VLLAIDTSTKIGSIALLDRAGALVAHTTLDAGTNHGAQLAPAVAALSIELGSLEAYALTIGPGSFTGLRIALCFVKGMALVFPRPVVPISTLEVIARGIFDAHPDVELALPMLDARRNEAYAALYLRSGGVDPALPEAAHPLEAIADRVRGRGRIIAAGDAVPLVAGPWEAAEPRLSVPDARVLAGLAWGRKSEAVPAGTLEPRYLQLAPAEQLGG
jgi:tRNA threonylcarbamoyladenosine biosynthesis protein TsaB